MLLYSMYSRLIGLLACTNLARSIHIKSDDEFTSYNTTIQACAEKYGMIVKVYLDELAGISINIISVGNSTEEQLADCMGESGLSTTFTTFTNNVDEYTSIWDTQLFESYEDMNNSIEALNVTGILELAGYDSTGSLQEARLKKRLAHQHYWFAFIDNSYTHVMYNDFRYGTDCFVLNGYPYANTEVFHLYRTSQIQLRTLS